MVYHTTSRHEVHGHRISNALNRHWFLVFFLFFVFFPSTRRTLISLPLSLASSLLMTFLGRRRGKCWTTKPRAQLETQLHILVLVEGTLPLQHKIWRGSHVLFKLLVWNSLRFNPALSWGKLVSSPDPPSTLQEERGVCEYSKKFFVGSLYWASLPPTT